MRAFRDLKVWRKGHELALAIYKATRAFPKDELYGLTSQLRRACVSIPSNIAEGCVKGSGAEFRHSLEIAMGSASEAEYQILLGSDLGYLSSSEYETLQRQVTEVKRMLTSFIQRLEAES